MSQPNLIIAPTRRGAVVENRVEKMADTLTTYERREDFVLEIGRLWADAEKKFLQIGRYLNQAKEKLAHGEWTTMVKRDLPFGVAMAHRLRAVATAIDSGRLPPSDQLPKSSSTIYLIATLDDNQLKLAGDRHLIRPDVRREEIEAFKAELKAAGRDPNSEKERLRRARRLLTERLRIERELAALAADLGDELDNLEQAIRAEMEAEDRTIDGQAVEVEAA